MRRSQNIRFACCLISLLVCELLDPDFAYDSFVSQTSRRICQGIDKDKKLKKGSKE
jgi:hypothetical protein